MTDDEQPLVCAEDEPKPPELREVPLPAHRSPTSRDGTPRRLAE